MKSQDVLMLYKFVVAQVKYIVCDEDGFPINKKAFDRVILDLYGLEDFAERLSRMTNNKSMRALIDKIGLIQLVSLLKNRTYCKVVNELVMIQKKMAFLRKKINKERHKGSGSKATRFAEKEYNDIKKLYERGIKSLRKELRIKNIHKAYKNDYMTLRNFTGQNRTTDLYWDDIEFDGISSVLDDAYADDPYDEDYDGFNYEDSTVLEDFMRELHGDDPRQPRRRRSFEFADDSDDMYELDDEEIEEDNSDYDELNQKLNNLNTQIQNLTNVVANNVRPQPQKKVRVQPQVQAPQQVVQYDPNLVNAVSDIQNCMNIMMDKMKDLDDRLNEFEVVVDEDSDIMTDPYAGETQNQFVQQMKQKQQSEVTENRPVQNTASIINSLNNMVDNAPTMTADMFSALDESN